MEEGNRPHPNALLATFFCRGQLSTASTLPRTYLHREQGADHKTRRLAEEETQVDSATALHAYD